MSGGRVKVRFIDSEGDGETLWGEPLGGDRVKLLNSPFFLPGVSWGDVVRVDGQDPPKVLELLEKSGHRTLRFLLPEQRDPQAILDALSRMNAQVEGAFGRVVVVDVPPDQDFWEVCRTIAQADVEWEFADPTHEELYGESAPDPSSP